MKNITVIIDRVSGSNIPTAKAEIEEVLEALKPLRERGLRVRVCRSHLTLKEDKPWRAKAAGAAVLALALVMLAAVAAPVAAQETKTFYDNTGRAIGRATTQGDTTTFYDSTGRSTGRATTTGNTTTIYDNTGRSTAAPPGASKCSPTCFAVPGITAWSMCRRSRCIAAATKKRSNPK
jgi:YD repeat-containing protein